MREKIITLLIITFAIAISYFIVIKKHQYDKRIVPQVADSEEQTSLPTAMSRIKKSKSFFFYKIPSPLSKLTLEDLPDTAQIGKMVEYKNHLWFEAEGSIVEFDPTTEKIISYSDANQANCDLGDIVLTKGRLYAVCRIDNIEDAFETTHILTTKLFTGHNGILKINPDTHKVEHIFNKDDGLLNGFNYELYLDGKYIWVATFNGLGRIDTQTDGVYFFRRFGFANTTYIKSYNIGPMIIDKTHVWAFFTASAESPGGVGLFDKSTQTWKGFGPSELKDQDFSRFDLDYFNGWAIKLVPDGLQMIFDDGLLGQCGRFVEKKYQYDTGVWTKVHEGGSTGVCYKEVDTYLEKNYPPHDEFFVKEDGLTQIKLPDSDKIYKLNGRKNFVISPVIDGKRYILTNASIDLIDNNSAYPDILMKIRHGFNFDEGGHQFLVDPNSLMAVVGEAFCGMGCYREIWLVDLKTGKILKDYDQDHYTLPALEEQTTKLSLINNGEFLIIKNEKGEEVFNINIKDYSLKAAPTPTPTPKETPKYDIN